MTGPWRRKLVRTFLVLLGLFTLAASGGWSDPFPREKGDRSVTFYVA